MGSVSKTLSEPISEDLPSGENLEYEPEYLEMVKLFEPRTKGGTIANEDDKQVAEPADWKGVAKLAGGLLEKSRDCRVLIYAAMASLHNKGLPEFRDYLQLLNVYLGDFWDSVHPQLDADDDNDATMRMNALEALDEYKDIVPALEGVKLVELKGVGAFGVREAELAQGKETPREGEEVPDVNLIRQAFMQSKPEHLSTLREAAQDSIELLKQIKRTWEEKSGGQAGPDFKNVVKALGKVVAVLDQFIPTEVQAQAVAEGEVVGAIEISGAIRSRADVVRVLDNICEYYTANEPSSPIPLLLRRAQRLVEKSFMEILADIVPDSVNQARIVSGKTDSS
jgi:type VI secretion system protein ImpA